MNKQTGKIEAGVAAIKVLESWGVEQIYGIPAGSLNSWMDALKHEETNMDFIQVRHEEVGALAASMQYKFNGKIGVALGSGGPGATHLMNGLYDAREDGVPMLAIIGQRAENEINMDAFQEMNHNPVFADVAVYNRRVAYPEQLPKIIDEAIRTAITRNGVACVEVPVNYGWVEIEEGDWYSSANAHRDIPYPVPDKKDIEAAAEILENAERPVIYAGIGTRGNGESVMELSRKLKAPVAVTGINYDTFPHDFEALLGSANRVARKPAVEVFEEADVVLFAGSNYPFTEVTGVFDHVKKFIQIDIDPYKLGKRHPVDVSILGDAGAAIRSITDKISEKPESGWYRANLNNIKNWAAYIDKLENKTEGELQVYQAYNAINKVADEDAIYSTDVGNTTQTSIRHLKMTPKNMWRTSGVFATMGNGLPGAIAAKKNFPDRQVWDLTGDGAFSMVMHDIITTVQHKLPSIHVVFSNEEYAFIKAEQEDTNHYYYGVDFQAVDYAKIGEAQGAVGFTVREISELDEVFQKAVEFEKSGRTVVINVKISDDRPIPVEHLRLDPKLYSEEEINEFKERYEAQELIPFSQFLEQEGLDSQVYKRRGKSKQHKSSVNTEEQI
ncbi:pyruvate oxidase [Marinilactibacillus psychrotolerans]|uniref:Pyruvate oxidase n=1 Tax=Marinilactibacillus psychrotolerans TaxID=191770 RepID=A0AAV3WYK6_9LACT|nr:pyruvate oxidase [Marinilactibacillus psychrotolerans]GEL66888.1 pyruvate oxidase [Marinilactibacillus psychrotolerans]GEQ35954.1 pyruvate oxidase [Marinilactibacillus psychrotolerans]SDC41671.1 pyruvate oxidase [Marinilactibacillus psychrotolerans]